MRTEERFLRACRRERADCTPVWFMRQAGRYMQEYRRIREKRDLMQMFKTPELAAEITMQPVKALDVDAAIIFADILLPLESMGIRIEFAEGEGPIINNPIRTRTDALAMRVGDAEQDLGYVLQALRLVRSELNERIPLIGFGGAPFTLASYAIEGGSSRNYILTKSLMYSEPNVWDMVMTKITDTLIDYLRAQIRAGAQVIQIFDSWVGCLSPSDYREYVLPHSERIFQGLKQAGVPSIHFGTGTGDLISHMSEAGGDVIGVDWRTHLDEAWARVGTDVGIQGNLDPVALLAPWEVLKERAKEVLDRAARRPGHIFNLGHGILPPTPIDAVRRVIDLVHNYR